MKSPIPEKFQSELPPFLASRFFDSSLGKIHYLKGGSGPQIIVLLHGNPTWSYLWRKVVSSLNPEHYTFIVPDLPGLGFSAPLSEKSFSIDTIAAAIKGLLQFENCENFIFVGQDWGGPIGLRAIATLKVKALVILNTAVAAPKLPMKRSWFHRFAKLPVISDLVFKVGGFPLFSLHTIQADQNSIRGTTAAAYRYPIFNNGHRSSALNYARMVPDSGDHPSYAILKENEKFLMTFVGAIKIVWGIKDPILGRGLKAARTLLPHAEIKEMPAGHFLQEECPQVIAEAIASLNL